MLSQKVFKEGLKEIEECFDNFVLTESKLKFWYKYSKNMDDYKWILKIANCIKGCRKVPTLADILDIKGYYYDNKTKEYELYEHEEFEHTAVPKDVKEKIDKMKKNWTIKKENNGSN